jgi:PKD repeat protein
VDDSEYLQAVIQEIKSLLNVDANRVYLTGFSTGGFMSYRLACDAPESVSALVSIAGATYKDPADCEASSPVHVLQVHGAADTSINPSGGRTASRPGFVYPGALETVRQWATIAGCSDPPVTNESRDLLSSIAGPETRVTRFADGCESGGSAELWLSTGADHWSYLAQPQFARQAVEWLLDHPKRPAPLARFELSTSVGDAPLEVVLDGTSSSFLDGAIAEHYWRFGDGETATGATVPHTFTEPGRYRPSLTVVSDDQRSSRRSRSSVTARCPAGDTGPWAADAVGQPAFPGTARLEDGGEERVLRVCTGGRDIAGRADECFLVSRTFSGDFLVTAEVTELLTDKAGAKVGLMARQNLDPGSPFAAVLLETAGSTPEDGSLVRLRSRTTAGSVARANGRQEYGGRRAWLRLERRGNVFIGAASPDGQEFVVVHEQVIASLPDSLLVGIAAAGRDSDPDAERFQPLQATIASLRLESSAPRFRRGDANGDDLLDMSDAIATLLHLFAGGAELDCLTAADANDSGALDVSDAIYTLGYLFLGTPAPPAPFPECGQDTDPDGLGCVSAPHCPSH